MVAVTISRGQRLKLTDLISNDSEFQLGITANTSELAVDFSCFGLDANGRLSDDRYMTFFNQPSTPCGGVDLSILAGDHSGFTIALQKLPVTIHRLMITSAIDGQGTMSQLTSVSIRFLIKGNEAARFAFTGSDFSAERALILLEIYRKDGIWRVAASGQGFNGGLEALVKHFGGTVAESKPNVSLSPPLPIASSNLRKIYQSTLKSPVNLPSENRIMKSYKGYTDMPVERLEDDVMDISVYVESLSEFILGCSTPMTIAIQGDWGSGKTSMMNMIKQKIESEIVSIWFNTWQYSQFEMASYLSISLLNNFLEKIGAKEESRNLLRSIAKGAFDFTKAAAVVVTEQVGGGTIAGHLRDTFSEVNKQDSAKILEELRDKICDAVNEKLKSLYKNRVVVFVDDLDRLAPEKAVELLEVLKIFMDVPNCVFVLAVDYGVVTQGLEKKFGASIGHSKGKSFFDKIIQLPFAIPIAQYNISAYIKNLLSNMRIDCSGEEINTYRDIVDSSIGCNPRGMKRLFNSFILLNTVATKKRMFDGTDGIKVKDKQRILFAALCLQMAFQEIYEFMIKNKNDLNVDFFNGIQELEKLKTDVLFEEIRKNIPIKEDLYYSKIANFMELFYKCLQLDDDLESLSDKELNNLKNILSFSAITANAPEKIQSQGVRVANNKEFWKHFLDKIKGRSELFQNISPSNDGWIASGVGISGVSCNVSVRKKSVKCALSLYRSSKDENKQMFDHLEKSKAEIEAKMGKPLEWRRLDDQKGSSIDSETTGINVYDQEDWPKIAEILIEDINKMGNVFGEYLNGYRKKS